MTNPGFNIDDLFIDINQKKTWVLLDILEHTSTRRGNTVRSYVIRPQGETFWEEFAEPEFLRLFKKIQAPQLSSKIQELERLFKLN